jgi:ribosome biogenesis protein BRX1
MIQVRSNEKKAKAGKFVKKVKAKQRRKTHLAANPLRPDELADVWED